MRLPYVVLLSALFSLEPNAIPTYFQTYQGVVGEAHNFKPPQGGAFGMTQSTSVYLSTPRNNQPNLFLESLHGATKTDVGAAVLLSWRSTMKAETTLYFALRLADGRLLMSNDRDEILRKGKELEHPTEQPCLALTEFLKAKPYWILRENLPASPIPFHDPALDQTVEWLSLSIDNDKRSTVVMHGQFKKGQTAPDLGYSLDFRRADSDFLATIDTSSGGAPNRWAAILSLFGFGIFL